MRHVPILVCGVAIAASSGNAWSQIAPGAIQGTVLSDDGKPVARAKIYYGRTGRVKAKAAASVLPPILAVKTGMDGRFLLPNLTPGGWTVCVEAAGYLNPCHWSTAPAFSVGAGQTIANAAVRVDEAYLLRVQISDPQGLLANEGKAAGAVLQLGVHAPSGAFQRATVASKESKSREYTIAVPLRAAAKLFVSGGAFQLIDAAGLPVSKNGKVSQLAAPDGNKAATTPQATLRFTVTGLGER
jgi:hypothetical protein